METLYKKVAVSERLPENKGYFDTDVGNIYFLKKTWQPSEFLRKAKVNKYHEDYFEEPEYWLEEIDEESLLKQNAELRQWKESSMQIMNDLQLQEIGKVLNLKLGSSISEQTLPAIKKLKADKAELLEALDNSLKVIEWYMENTMPESDNHTDFFNIGMNQRSEIESLIQKMKKCQENTPR